MFIDAIVVQIRDGHVPNRPSYAAIVRARLRLNRRHIGYRQVMGLQSSAKEAALSIADAERADGKARRKPFWSGAKFVAFAAVVYFFVLPLIPGFRKAAGELRRVSPLLVALGVGLEAAALYAYSLLTRAALGTSRKALSSWRMFRIQMSTKALGGIMPGGSAASSAMGYHLLTSSGVTGTDAGRALSWPTGWLASPCCPWRR